MRVGIVYDAHAAAPDAAPDVAGVLASVEAVAAALRAHGHEAVRIGVSTGSGWLAALRASGADVVFNLCEGIDGDAAQEAAAAAAIEETGLPCTGADAPALGLARRKDRVNALLAPLVPIPPWALASPRTPGEWRHFPAIVKPAGEDAGIGIGPGAVAYTMQELARALDAARDRDPLLVQRFLPGRELIVGIVGNTVLPVAEVDYGAMPATLPRVVGYAAKWEEGSVEDLGTRTRCPASIAPTLAAEAATAARVAWQAVARRGYGRIDLRADERGVLHVLDVNPNPDLAPDAGLARMAAAAGWSYERLVAEILQEALLPAMATP